MANYSHPARADLSLTAVLSALGDPIRLSIVRHLYAHSDGLSCSVAAEPLADLPKSTLSNHFRVLREAGLIRTTKKGVETINVVRTEDLNARFPKLLATLLSLKE